MYLITTGAVSRPLLAELRDHAVRAVTRDPSRLACGVRARRHRRHRPHGPVREGVVTVLVTGRPARTFAEWADENAEHFR